MFGKADKTAANSTLLPDDLRDRRRCREKQVVDLVGRHPGARATTTCQIGDKTASVFAVPTTEGVATLACAADAETCETIASSLQITEGEAFPVGPSEELLQRRRARLGTLEKQREVRGRASSTNAGKRTTQVAATSKLGTAYAAPPSRSASSTSARPTRS